MFSPYYSGFLAQWRHVTVGVSSVTAALFTADEEEAGVPESSHCIFPLFLSTKCQLSSQGSTEAFVATFPPSPDSSFLLDRSEIYRFTFTVNINFSFLFFFSIKPLK